MIAIFRKRAKTESQGNRIFSSLIFGFSCLLTCLLFSWLGIQAAYPFVLAQRLRAGNDDVDREVRRYRLINQRIEKEVKAMGNRDGVVRAARRYGWVLPGEVRLHLPAASSTPKKP